MSVQLEEDPNNDAWPGSRPDDHACFACASKAFTLKSGLRDFHTALHRQYALFVCKDCGSAQLAEKLTQQEQATVYPSTFYSYVLNNGRHPFMRALDKFRYDRHRFRPIFRRLLEIGSGCGEFLATLKSRGEVTGLERSQAARAEAKKLGVDVQVGDVSDPNLFGARSFDYIYLSHSFEHLDRPAVALTSMHLWLEENGRVFIAVPNYAGLLPRIFSKSWYNLALPLHVSQFTPRGIRALLERSGFTVDQIRYNSDPFSIPMSLLFAASGNAGSLRGLLKLAIFCSSLLLVPVSRFVDLIGRGDCMEVYARKQ